VEDRAPLAGGIGAGAITNGYLAAAGRLSNLAFIEANFAPRA
jgi:hypothetical protein